MVQRTAEELGAWLATRLSNESAKTEWRKNIAAAWERLSAEQLSVVLPRAEWEALVTAHVADETRLEALLTFYVRAVLIPTVTAMRADRQKLSRWIPPDARNRWLALIGEKGMVDPAWIRSIFKEPAIEAIVSDTLYRALIDFSTIIPRLIQNMPALGGFAKIGGIGTRIVEEIEKRLEPEIRRFLDKGTRKALDGASKFTIDHLDDKTSIEFRKNMLSFAIDQEAAFHVHALTDQRLKEIEEIARTIARHVAKSEETKTRIKEEIGKIADKYGQKTIAEVIKELGGIESPPFDEWSDATFSIISRAVTAPEVATYMGTIALELLEEVERTKS